MPMTKAKILIVEDEAIAAENIAGRLQQQGYDVLGIVDTGMAAIEAAKHKQPDLVLMDIMLKGDLDGVSAAKEIYAQYQIPVVYMTAFADDKTIERVKDTEPFGYLVKPFKPQELKATVEVALRKHQSEIDRRSALAQTEKLRDQAESISALKSDFVAMVSHEFRNPLSTIYLSTDLLENQGQHWSEEKRSKRFQRIKQSIERMTDLLDDVLSMSKAEAGKLRLQPELFDLETFCRDLVDEMRAIAGINHTVTFISYCISSEVRTSYMDMKVLRYILSNLLSNAIKYSPNGGIVHLRLMHPQEADVAASSKLEADQNLIGDDCKHLVTSKIIFQIRDQGIGIPPEDMESLFDPFYRSTNVGKIVGSGLGLSIVKKYVELLGGSIMVQSEVGVGSTFTVALPLVTRRFLSPLEVL
jgi:signal transduction histidine kinase